MTCGLILAFVKVICAFLCCCAQDQIRRQVIREQQRRIMLEQEFQQDEEEEEEELEKDEYHLTAGADIDLTKIFYIILKTIFTKVIVFQIFYTTMSAPILTKRCLRKDPDRRPQVRLGQRPAAATASQPQATTTADNNNISIQDRARTSAASTTRTSGNDAKTN